MKSTCSSQEEGEEEDIESQMTMYDCGHSFHIECIIKHIAQSKSKDLRQGQSPIVTQKMMNQQLCPWCYSDKFKIDFDKVF